MAIKLKFDQNYNVTSPTFVLATKSGDKLGAIPAENIVVKTSMNDADELSFTIQKSTDDVETLLWDEITDFKLLWCRDWDLWFEIYVEVDETSETVKNITAVSLGEAELSQIYLYDIEINTEDDIARDDYIPTVLYNESNSKASLLNRILEKAPHYTVHHVDISIQNIQRTFSFDGETIYDAFQDIAEEINCIFVINCSTASDGKIQREIDVYDLESYCLDCGHRDEFLSSCPECGSQNIMTGYGTDTTIFVSTQNLSEEIQYSVDTDSVKNCFRLKAGDDLMTATVRNCNPNGSGYIWYISDELKKDMSDELVSKLESYDTQYDFYQNSYQIALDNSLVTEYNQLVSKYTVGMNLFSNGSSNVQLSEGGTSTISAPGYITSENIQFIAGQMLRFENVDDFKTLRVAILNASQSVFDYLTYDTLKKYGNVVENEKSLTWYTVLTDTSQNMAYIRFSCKANKENIFVTNRSGYYLFSSLPQAIVGYPSLMNYYYDTIDFYLFLQNNMMPEVTVEKTTAIKELGKLSRDTLSPVGVMNLDRASEATVSNAVLAMAKILVNSTYRVQTTNESLSSVSTVDTGDGQEYQTATWSGQFIITSYSDEEDTATSGTIQVRITNQYEEYVKQKIDKELNKKSDEATDIVALFNLDDDDFKEELTKYCLSRLTSFHDACQACLDILIEQGIADRETWANSVPDMYNEVYIPYYNKLGYIQDEINVRESEIETITGKYDSEDRLLESGVQTALEDARIEIQNALNFENYIGEDLWKEFSAYRREDEYTNENYVSDGLNNTELFQKAKQFISVAEKEIYKSAVLQHVVSANLKSFLTMEEFAPIVDYFETGNWIRVQANDVIYRLRLLEYQVQFGERGEVSSIDVEFSDVRKTATGMSDIESVLDEASSMATSYDSVARQADDGAKGNEKLQNWVTKGLALTQMKIIDNADYQNITFDSHGLLCKEFNPMTEEYDDKQLKIINRGLYLTDDNWLTSRAGIGDFAFYNPMTKQMEESYGVIADTLVGNLILSEKVGVYNTNNGIVMDEFGLTITTHSDSIDDEVSGDTSLGAFTIQNEYTAADGSTQTEKLFYIDSDGNVVLNGNIRINTPVNINVDDEEEENPENTDYIITINDLCDPTRITNAVDSKFGELQTQFETSIDKAYADAMAYADQILNGYKADVGQYMQYGLDGLTLGAVSSPFKTLIDNQGMYFKQDDSIVSYVNNHQLYIPNAVIESTLTIGNFFFSPYPDGSVSLTWQN